MSDGVKAILSKLNVILDELEKVNKKLETIPVLEIKLTSVSQRIKALEEVMGVYLDKASNKSKDKPVESKSEETVYYSMKDVPKEDRPPYWDHKFDCEQSLWKLLQSKEGKEEIKRIYGSTKDTEEVREAKRIIKAFSGPAKILLASMKEKSNT